MRIAFRNFLSTLRRYKAASLLNVIGLTLAFTAFYIILVQVVWELGYNRTLPDAERVYAVETEDWYDPGTYSSWLNRPVPERVIAASPEVEAGGCLWGGFAEDYVWLRNVSGVGYNKFKAGVGSVSLPLLDVFGFRSVAGDVHDLNKARTVLISRSAAERLGVGPGDMLWTDTDSPTPENMLEIAAVFEDFPDNSLLAECEVVKNLGEYDLDNTSEWSFNYFVKLRPGADPAAFERRYAEISREIVHREAERAQAAEEQLQNQDEDVAPMRLHAVRDLYFSVDSNGPGSRGSAVTTYTLLGIAVLVIVLAFINFVNFFFALVPVRIRSVNTFKVFGAPASSLRFGFVFEALGLVVISLLLSWWLALIVQGTEFASYIPAPLALSRNLSVVALAAVVAFVMALAASLYPACYITSFAPAMVVKGSFSGTRGGRRLRTLLLGVQFFISIGLIVTTGFIRLQHQYMMHYDMGFDKHDLVAAGITQRAAMNYGTLREKLLADPRVVDVTGATGRLVAVNRMGWGREFKGEQVAFQSYVVQWNFLRMMGIGIAEGRDFLESDMHRELGALIFNEAARRQFDMQVGDRINGFGGPDEQIVGFCTDFNFKPLQYGVAPFAFYVVPAEYEEKGWQIPRVVYVRTTPGADVAAVSELIRRSVCEVDPKAVPSEVHLRTFEDELGSEYAQEQRLTTIVGLFTLLSVAIALMGVFGIVLFETQHRRREIAVRRVMGASRGEILALFNRRYVWTVAVCFVLAAPVAWYAVDRWLSTFAYRTPVVWWIFAGALGVVLTVTVLTVTVRSWAAANENPAESVKSE